jgi:hypothetical protein
MTPRHSYAHIRVPNGRSCRTACCGAWNARTASASRKRQLTHSAAGRRQKALSSNSECDVRGMLGAEQGKPARSANTHRAPKKAGRSSARKSCRYSLNFAHVPVPCSHSGVTPLRLFWKVRIISLKADSCTAAAASADENHWTWRSPFSRQVFCCRFTSSRKTWTSQATSAPCLSRF